MSPRRAGRHPPSPSPTLQPSSMLRATVGATSAASASAKLVGRVAFGRARALRCTRTGGPAGGLVAVGSSAM